MRCQVSSSGDPVGARLACGDFFSLAETRQLPSWSVGTCSGFRILRHNFHHDGQYREGKRQAGKPSLEEKAAQVRPKVKTWLQDLQVSPNPAAKTPVCSKTRGYPLTSTLGTSLRIRRIKCDLSRPSCSRCTSTGRTCDGYGEGPPSIKTQTALSYHHDNNTSTSHHGNCPLSNIIRTTNLPTLPQSLPPFMILPATTSNQIQAMTLFEGISISHLNEYRPSGSWRNTLMFFSQTNPSVRHAALALALMHRKYLDGKISDDEAPLYHYNRAIQLLLNQGDADSAETTAITLLVCYLFVCFDHLARNYVQAIKHLKGGVELARSIDRDTLDGVGNPGGTQGLIRQVTRQIRRLDMQAVTFLVDWTPADSGQEDTPLSRILVSQNAFASLDQAADYLQVLVTRVMKITLRNLSATEEQSAAPTEGENETPTPPPEMTTPSSSSLVTTLLNQLETWSTLLENTLLSQKSHAQTHANQPINMDTFRLISLLRLHYTISWILLSVHVHNHNHNNNEITENYENEMRYDNHLPQFQHCLAFAREVHNHNHNHHHHSKTTNTNTNTTTLTPEVGLLPVLYIIGAKCRHPHIRREVLRILRQRPIREAVWDSVVTARVVERIMEVEEEEGCDSSFGDGSAFGFGGDGEMGEGEGLGLSGMVQRENGIMGEIVIPIPIWRRIEAVSWVHVVDGGPSGGRVDVRYRFCRGKRRVGDVVESLVL